MSAADQALISAKRGILVTLQKCLKIISFDDQNKQHAIEPLKVEIITKKHD